MHQKKSWNLHRTTRRVDCTVLYMFILRTRQFFAAAICARQCRRLHPAEDVVRRLLFNDCTLRHDIPGLRKRATPLWIFHSLPVFLWVRERLDIDISKCAMVPIVILNRWMRRIDSTASRWFQRSQYLVYTFHILSPIPLTLRVIFWVQ